MSDHGVVLDPTSICFTRILPASVDEVWAFLTESEKRGRWLASGDMDLREGGGVTLRFVHADLSSVAEPVPEAYKPLRERRHHARRDHALRSRRACWRSPGAGPRAIRPKSLSNCRHRNRARASC